MGSLDLTIQVLNISPKTTTEDLIAFFSYCGSIDQIELQRDGDDAQMAFVTFTQPYALHTALLLNDATIADRQVRIVPPETATSIPIEHCSSIDMKYERSNEGSVLGAQSAIQTAIVGGQKAFNKVKEQLFDTSKALKSKANSDTVLRSDCFSKAAMWLFGILKKASKRVVELGNLGLKTTSS